MKSILTISEIAARTTLSRATIYRLVAKGRFPKPIPLSEHRVGWLADEIDAWLRARAHG